MKRTSLVFEIRTPDPDGVSVGWYRAKDTLEMVKFLTTEYDRARYVKSERIFSDFMDDHGFIGALLMGHSMHLRDGNTVTIRLEEHT